MLLQSWSTPTQTSVPELLTGPQEIVPEGQLAVAEHVLAGVGSGTEKIASSRASSAAAGLG